jgi:hypothetical protein
MTDLKIERITEAKKIVPLARIFYTDSSRGAANPDADTTGGRETAVETALALGGSPERARRAGASESTKVMDCDDSCMFHTVRGAIRS